MAAARERLDAAARAADRALPPRPRPDPNWPPPGLRHLEGEELAEVLVALTICPPTPPPSPPGYRPVDPRAWPLRPDPEPPLVPAPSSSSSSSLSEDEFEVEAILDQRRRRTDRGRVTEYLVRWRGFGPEADTWEPLANLSNCGPAYRDWRRRSGGRH